MNNPPLCGLKIPDDSSSMISGSAVFHSQTTGVNLHVPGEDDYSYIDFQAEIDPYNPCQSTTAVYFSSYSIPNRKTVGNSSFVVRLYVSSQEILSSSVAPQTFQPKYYTSFFQPSALPSGMVYSPYVQIVPPPPLLSSPPSRCKRCGYFINIYCKVGPLKNIDVYVPSLSPGTQFMGLRRTTYIWFYPRTCFCFLKVLENQGSWKCCLCRNVNSLGHPRSVFSYAWEWIVHEFALYTHQRFNVISQTECLYQEQWNVQSCREKFMSSTKRVEQVTFYVVHLWVSLDMCRSAYWCVSRWRIQTLCYIMGCLAFAEPPVALPAAGDTRNMRQYLPK